MRIATRQSRLALWQANHVAGLLRQAHPGLAVDLVPMTTQGDRVHDRPLADVGGKGLFVKELERAIADGRADIAVHSTGAGTSPQRDGAASGQAPRSGSSAARSPERSMRTYMRASSREGSRPSTAVHSASASSQRPSV